MRVFKKRHEKGTKMKRILILIISLMLVITLVACAGTSDKGDGSGTGSSTSGIGTDPAQDDTTEDSEQTPPPSDTDAVTTYLDRTEPEPELDAPLTVEDPKTLAIDSSVRHQVIESFGASGAWWAQYAGSNTKTRDHIAELLFDPVNGIGLNSYRYNVGAGSRDKSTNSPAITDPRRRAYSFERSPGEYNWNRDKAAIWFMEKAVELGVDEIVMFANSPLERLTKNGNAYGNPGYVSNIDPENYEAFATYLLDVAEHFKSEGLPVKFISPINEPAFEWSGGQEGSHYSDKEVIALLKVFVEEIGKREGLRGVEISGPEGSSWRNSPSQWEDDTLGLCQRIMKDSTLKNYFTSLDAHSYWSTKDAKKNFIKGITKVAPDIKLRQTEWCEMKGANEGQDAVGKLAMPSGLTIAEVIHEDMTILDCVSWSFWTAVSAGDYGDGLVYTDGNSNNVKTSKRLWSMGNYSRYIDRGYTRVDCGGGTINILVSAYEGINEYGEPETVIVIVNKNKDEKGFNFSGIDTSVYNRISVVTTDKTHDLEETYYSEFVDGTAISVPGESVTTVIISGRK